MSFGGVATTWRRNGKLNVWDLVYLKMLGGGGLVRNIFPQVSCVFTKVRLIWISYSHVLNFYHPYLNWLNLNKITMYCNNKYCLMHKGPDLMNIGQFTKWNVAIEWVGYIGIAQSRKLFWMKIFIQPDTDTNNYHFLMYKYI